MCMHLYYAYRSCICKVCVMYMFVCWCFLMQSWRVGLLVSAAGDRTEKYWYGVGVDGKTPPVSPRVHKRPLSRDAV